MKNRNRIQANLAVFRGTVMVLLSLMVVLVTSGCEGPNNGEGGDGVIVNELILPTDTLLNLACADVGIFTEQCVLTDLENPFRHVVTLEFDVNNPGGPTKFDLFDQIPAGPTGAKARFYLFATALARRTSGENQWWTARSLHELYDLNSDDLIRAQALKAYRSVLDNFFGSVVFFDVFGSALPFNLNERAACDILRPGATGFAPLVLNESGTAPGTDLDILERFGDWGYAFQPGTGDNCDGSLLTINGG